MELRYQNAVDIRTDLQRLRPDTDSSRSDAVRAASAATPAAVSVPAPSTSAEVL
jgi:hypothetical protein